MIWSISKQPDIKLYVSQDEICTKEWTLEIKWVVFDHIKSTTRKVTLLFWDHTSPFLEQWKTYDELWDTIHIPMSELVILEQNGRASARFDGRMSKYYILVQDRLQSEDLFWYECVQDLLSK